MGIYKLTSTYLSINLIAGGQSMTKRAFVLLGTKKGAFILESDATRKTWSQRGPFCETWPMNHVIADPATGTIYAGGGNEWFGPAVWKSTDLGANWTHSSEGLAYPAGEEAINSVWSLGMCNGRVYAGVQPAGLFSSEDGGETWTHVSGLRAHPTRPAWQPGGAGLILHSIVTHLDDPNQIWIGISAAGVFYTADGGVTWEPRNSGTRCDYLPEAERYPEFGQCVHCIVRAAGPSNRLYQQNHCGMYRSDDGGRNWESIEAGLPSSFGFPVVAHPRDPSTLFLVPLNGDIAGRYVPGGKAAVWRTRDGGSAWEAKRDGLPQGNAFFGVLRQAMAADRLEPAGIYAGTNTGTLFASADEAETWSTISQHLPPILSVETLVLEA
jgi:photosystem II stability/assembly factor-like uncharacterized protein